MLAWGDSRWIVGLGTYEGSVRARVRARAPEGRTSGIRWWRRRRWPARPSFARTGRHGFRVAVDRERRGVEQKANRIGLRARDAGRAGLPGQVGRAGPLDQHRGRAGLLR